MKSSSLAKPLAGSAEAASVGHYLAANDSDSLGGGGRPANGPGAGGSHTAGGLAAVGVSGHGCTYK